MSWVVRSPSIDFQPAAGSGQRLEDRSAREKPLVDDIEFSDKLFKRPMLARGRGGGRERVLRREKDAETHKSR